MKNDPTKIDKINEARINLIKLGIEDSRNNILERVKQRELTLVFYLGAVSTIMGIAFNAEKYNYNLLLLIPFLSIGTTLLVSFHNSMMNSLSEFIVKELEPELKLMSINVPLWDTSIAMSRVSKRASLLRVSGFLFLLLFPPIFSLSINLAFIGEMDSIMKSLWVIGLISVIVSILIFGATVSNRWKFHNRVFEN